MRKFGWLVLALLALREVWAFEPKEYSFLISAQVAYSPARLILNWESNPALFIQVRRKLPSDTAWSPIITTLPAGATSFTDSNIDIGAAYEYQLAGPISDMAGGPWVYGYISAGIEVPAEEKRGKVILIIDQTHAAALASELATLKQDLIGDGWTVLRHDVSPNDSVTQVKALIQADYNADPANVRSVFLFGHVPVPYSGLINPDMHPNHLGAWPADSYYADMTGLWTDSTVNKPDSEYPENDNVPGDGKFDQSVIPSQVELEVGRVDLWGLPAFNRSERELLRNYLNKDHRFRHAQLTAPARGLIRDNFGIIDDDAPAADAWRAFPAFFGQNTSREIGSYQFFPTLANEAFLWAYAGGGGSYDHVDGVGSTADFASGDPKAIFLLLHGSYFGDWNNEDNFLRAALATPTYSLVSIWSSLPHWYFQNVALGETIGFAVKLTQNNRGLYRNSMDYSLGQVHTSMLGDPTLRPFVIPPPSNPRITAGSKLTLTWDYAPVANEGYNVYRAISFDGPFTRLNRSVIMTNRFEQTPPAAGNYVYMIRTAARQTTGSGTFQNLSQGIFLPYTQTSIQLPEVNVTALDSQGDENGDYIVLQFTRTGDTTAGLWVDVDFLGTATPGLDYNDPGLAILFVAGQSERKITLTPTSDDLAELAETIQAKIVPGDGYLIGSQSTATATISANGESKITQTQLSPSNGFTFTATGFANGQCLVESRSPDGAWRTRTNITAGADGKIIYREALPTTQGAELYRISWP